MFSRQSRLRTGILAAVIAALALAVVPAASAAIQDPDIDVDELLELYRQRLAEIEHQLQAREAEVRARLENALAEDNARVQTSLEQGMQERMAAEEQRLHEVEAALAAQRDRGPLRVVGQAPHGARWLGRGGHFGMDGGADWVLAHAEELELTEEQEDRIREAERTFRRAEIERDADIEVAELDLEDLLREHLSADLTAVEEQMRRIADLRVQDRIARLRLRRQIHDVLTPEQQEELEEMRPERLHARLLMEDGPAVWRFRHMPGERFEFRMPEFRERMERWLDDDDGRFRFFRFEHDEDEETDEEEGEQQEGEVDGAARGGRADSDAAVVVTI